MIKFCTILSLIFFVSCLRLEADTQLDTKAENFAQTTGTTTTVTVSDTTSKADKLQALKQNFLREFSSRFPDRVLASIDSNFERFFDEVKALLESASLYDLRLVDKTHYLPASFAPDSLVALVTNPNYTISKTNMLLTKSAEAALQTMAKAARKENITLLVSSAYRTYAYQEGLFARYAAQYGEEAASRFSARAGTSQHQLGTAIDFGSITDAFAETKAGKWLYENAGQYGWSLSYPKGYEQVTGYKWECWHYRYIGEPACQMQKKWFLDIQQYLLEALDFFFRQSND